MSCILELRRPLINWSRSTTQLTRVQGPELEKRSSLSREEASTSILKKVELSSLELEIGRASAVGCAALK